MDSSAESADCGRGADEASDAAGDENPDEAESEAESEAAEGGKPRGGLAALAPRAAFKK